MLAFTYIAVAYLVLPLLTLYSCFSAIYLLDFRDPDFISFLVLWTPGVFLYYIYIGQLIIGQRLPFLDRIWGFPHLVRKHQGLFRYLLIVTLVIHTTVHLNRDGLDKLLWGADLGLIVMYIAIVATFVLIFVARHVWLKPQRGKKEGRKSKVADYGKMHRLHQLFYLIAVGVWFHVITAGAFDDNFLGEALITAYLLFAFGCKLYMIWAQRTAPGYRLESVEQLHKNFVRLKLGAPLQEAEQQQTGLRASRRRLLALQQHEAGQYAYFSFALPNSGTIGTKSKQGKNSWEQHPFSFAAYAAQDAQDSDADSSVLTIVIKNLGDFTSRIAQLQPGSEVRVLGSYGKFSCAVPRFTDGVRLIAAGIGITPFLSMLEQRAAQAECEGQMQEPAQVFRPTSKPMELHWFVLEPEELVFDDRFRYFLDRIPNLKIQTYVGQLLTEDVLQQILTERQASASLRELGVLYCGPPAVGPTLRKVMAKLGIPRRNFHTELFSM